MFWITALLTGFFGSFHCAGMCGPIAFALPGKQIEGAGFYFGRLLYNSGRIVTYSCLGIVSGAFGLGLKLAGFQQSISIIAGILILVMVALNQTMMKTYSFRPLRLFSSKKVHQLFNSKALSALFFIGVFNGLLPCGFVYIALPGATATQEVWEGAFFMIFLELAPSQ